ncbi:MAG: hypothetical protein J2P21_01770 [Chloracidobacterium sp.]|nr:hypothetical protein [Chloracidobacterium sp.]
MIWKIVRKECEEMWREGRMRWAEITVLTLLVGSLALGFGITARPATSEKWRARQKAPEFLIGRVQLCTDSGASTHVFSPSIASAMRIQPGKMQCKWNLTSCLP